jgi:tRNA U34 5-methylaminomethyl-2-thiouridine-forming methyltransferase MnmC
MPATTAPVPDFTPPTDFMPHPTADGSRTLYSETIGEHYHSFFGAVAESEHVYIDKGFRSCVKPHLDILEVGLGTGLNALLTLAEAQQKGSIVNYMALEPFPLELDIVRALQHPESIGRPELIEPLEAMMSAHTDHVLSLTPGFTFQKSAMRIQEMDAVKAFDLVYFDAFAPKVQPEMWTVEVFNVLHRAMKPGALLVTYCAKGDVRRAMRDAGLVPELVQGPPGKYKMLKARRT